MSVTQITDMAERLIKNLSKGYKQRVGIAQALLGNPEVIILDEPTVGLDPKQIIEIRDLIKTLGQKHTVILSSHILSEVRAVCQTVLIISKGYLVACDTPDNLERLFAGSVSIELTVEATEDEARTALENISQIKSIQYTLLQDGQLHIVVNVDGQADLRREIFFAFAHIERPIIQMTTTKANLEDIFIELTSSEKVGTDEVEPITNEEAK